MSEQKKMDAERAAFEVWAKESASIDRNKFHPEFYEHLPTRRMWDAWQARASLPVGVPDGYVLVPLIATPEMIEAAVQAIETKQALWHAMLAAAPTVKAEPAQCTNEDSWNCKYCRKTETCEALADKRNFGTTAPSLPAAGSAVEEVEAVAWQDADNPMYTTAERRVML
ncbi:hypothetical protein ACNFCJ_21090, partial [Pseudomonas sp. NY15364]|uniref:hypothetical protein n=1 Tax=Pseudomonas sp. NY15364 TaxID=3400353 RepID=UPI003A84CA59